MVFRRCLAAALHFVMLAGASAGDLLLQARLLSPSRVAMGEPVYLELSVVNDGSTEAIIPFAPDDAIVVKTRIIGPSGEVVPYIGSDRDVAGSNRIVLEPGGRSIGLYLLNKDHDLRDVGAYTVEIAYEAHEFVEQIDPAKGQRPHWTGKLIAPPVQFAIDPVTADAQQQYEEALKAGLVHHGAVWFARNKRSAALEFVQRYPGSRLAPYVRYNLGEDFVSANQCSEARVQLEPLSVDQTFPLAAYALRNLEECHRLMDGRNHDAAGAP